MEELESQLRWKQQANDNLRKRAAKRVYHCFVEGCDHHTPQRPAFLRHLELRHGITLRQPLRALPANAGPSR